MRQRRKYITEAVVELLLQGMLHMYPGAQSSCIWCAT